MTFKPGELVQYAKWTVSAPNHVMVVEQVYSRGKAEHVLCSFRDHAWTPIMAQSAILTKADPNA